jgi:hypothetical protein
MDTATLSALRVVVEVSEGEQFLSLRRRVRDLERRVERMCEASTCERGDWLEFRYHSLAEVFRFEARMGDSIVLTHVDGKYGPQREGRLPPWAFRNVLGLYPKEHYLLLDEEGGHDPRVVVLPLDKCARLRKVECYHVRYPQA